MGVYGYSDFWEYDSIANTWTQKADFGGGVRSSAVGFSIGSKGYIGTGWDGTAGTKDFWEYDPVGDTWTRKADFGGGVRWSAVGFSIGSRGYIGTGFNEGSAPQNDFWEYDPVADTWTQKADFGDGVRDLAVGFSIGSKGYIGTGSGSGSDGYYTKDFWEYDSAANMWTKKADLGGVVRIWSVGFSIGSKGYIGTGRTAGVTDVKDFWEYEPIDTTPDQFIFTDQTNVSMIATNTSNTIRVLGINTAVPISITGGKYSINGGAYTSANGTVSAGDRVTVQLVSSWRPSTMTNATLTIGGISDTFSVTTFPTPDTPGGHGGCFIATAAFGSPLAGQVEILRQFRDRYLLTNSLGRKFVAWYYRNGPAAANYINDKPLVKVTVRAALYPLIGFSLLLISGSLPFIIVGLLLSTLLCIRFRMRKLSAD